MSTLRLKRLAADYEKLREYVRRHKRLALIAAEGEPPERYQIEYRIRSLRQSGSELETATTHKVEIVLPRDYPRAPPHCRMLTPVFHPNIAPHAICVGDHWSAGEPISSIVARIGEILAYQSYNTKSPLNGEAAPWVEEHLDELPLDNISMIIDAAPKEKADAAPAPAKPAAAKTPTDGAESASPAKPASPAAVIPFRCPSCGTGYKIPGEFAGKKVRCKTCQAVTVVPVI